MNKSLQNPFTFPLYFYTIAAKSRKVGGQAIIEGVMMRGKKSVSWAVRRNEQEIVVERRQYLSVSKKYKLG